MATRDQSKAADFAHIYRGAPFRKGKLYFVFGTPENCVCAAWPALGSFQWAEGCCPGACC
eukprot:10808420-Alexandrium_andersonii.AAC.1